MTSVGTPAEKTVPCITTRPSTNPTASLRSVEHPGSALIAGSDKSWGSVSRLSGIVSQAWGSVGRIGRSIAGGVGACMASAVPAFWGAIAGSVAKSMVDGVGLSFNEIADKLTRRMLTNLPSGLGVSSLLAPTVT